LTRLIPTMKYLSIYLTILLSCSSFAFEPFHYEYSSKISGLKVKSERTLVEYEPGFYELKIKSSNMVARYEEASRFTLDHNGYPIPIENWTKSTLFGVGRTAKNVFDWNEGIATYTRKEDVRKTKITPGILDRLIYQLLLAEDLRSGKTSFEYRFSDRGSIQHYLFENLGLEKIEIGKKQLEAYRLRRVSENNERETQFWISPELNFQLVHLTHKEKEGSNYEMTIKL